MTTLHAQKRWFLTHFLRSRRSFARHLAMRFTTRIATRIAAACGLVALAVIGLGCGSVSTYYYQPLSGFQAPLAVDIRKPNLDGLRIEVRASVSPQLEKTENEGTVLANAVQDFLRNQGAKVSENDSDSEKVTNSENQNSPEVSPQALEMRLEVEVRRPFEQPNTWMWLPWVATFTLLPHKSEYILETEMRLSDGAGFLLSRQIYFARFVRYTSPAYRVLSVLFDFFRKPEEKATVARLHQDFTADFYGQMTQQIYNARIRANVLGHLPQGKNQ